MTYSLDRLLRVAALAVFFAGAIVVQAQSAAPGASAGGNGGNGGSTGGGSTSGGGSTGGGEGGAGYSNGFSAASQRGFPPVKPITRATETAISLCDENNPRCVADALDAYAEALRILSPPLPPELQGLPDVVSRAARRVRAARTKAEAIRAVKAAIGEVHKTIALLKADDPLILKETTREGSFIAETLEVANDKLEKASSL